MASKAAAALQRLREIDKKYKYRQEEKFTIDSDISSKESSVTQNVLRAQLNIKIPDANEEQVDTNSSNSTIQEVVAVKVLSNVAMSPNSFIKDSNNEKSVSVERLSSNIESDVGENSSINTSKDESSISENLEESIQSISEMSASENEDSRLDQAGVKSVESTSQSQENINNSKSSSSANYSDDSFDSSSSAGESEKFDDTAVQTKTREPVNDEVKIPLNNHEQPVLQLSEHELVNRSSDRDDLFEKKEENSESAASEGAQSSKSTHLPAFELTNNLDSVNNTTKDESENNSSLSQVNLTSRHSLSSEKSTEKSTHRRTPSNTSILTLPGDFSITRQHRRHKNRPSKSVETDKRSKSMTKYLEEKIEKECHRLREQKRLHATMIRYLEKLEEDRQTLLLGPRKLIYPEKPEYHHLQPLDFPKIENFRRADCSGIVQADPCVEMLGNRLQDIRQWLKEQYLLYREHCDLATSVNKTYSPITREDTRKLIARLKRRSINERIIQINQLRINQTI